MMRPSRILAKLLVNAVGAQLVVPLGEHRAVTCQNLGEMITRMQYSNDAVIINKGGKPAAVLIDSALYNTPSSHPPSDRGAAVRAGSA
jgi:hypothetical protein